VGRVPTVSRQHDWAEPGGIEVRHVQPYQADKTYRCPGCDHEIRPGEGHKVVIPLDAPEDRRHWHTGCWHREEKQRARRR
jgi:hypothetical protein